MDLGVHLAVNSEWTGLRWGPVSSHSNVPSLLDKQGYLPLVEEDVVLNARPAEVERELRAQIERARAMGIRITHLDSHMGTLHRTPVFFSILRKLAHEAGLPYLVRPESPRPIPDDEVLAQEIVSMDPGISKEDWFQEYKRQLQNLPPGIYQMTVHLAHDDEEMQGATRDHPDWGAAWRQADFDLLRSSEFQDWLQKEGFVLVRWKDLSPALPPDYRQRQ